MSAGTPKTHIPHWNKPGVGLCGARALTDRAGRKRSAPVFIGRMQVADEATCRNCWAADDALQVRNHRSECKAAGIDPVTLEKLK